MLQRFMSKKKKARISKKGKRIKTNIYIYTSIVGKCVQDIKETIYYMVSTRMGKFMRTDNVMCGSLLYL